MDYKAILSLIKEMNNTDLTKLEIEEEGLRICMEKTVNTVTVAAQPISQVTMAPAMSVNPMAAMPMQASVMPMQPVIGQAPVQVDGVTSEINEKQAEEAGTKKITSPMVGTFYKSPSPDKPEFVKVGDKVKKGQTVCIIEAMKLLNEIESDHDGEIVKILVNNEEMVEFGQPLFLIK